MSLDQLPLITSLSFDQRILMKISNMFLNRKLSSPYERTLCSFIVEVVEIVSGQSSAPCSLLLKIGLIFFPDLSIGINKRMLSKFFFMTRQSMANTIRRHGWKRVKPVIDSCNLKKLGNFSLWSFFQLPEDSAISDVVIKNPCVISSGSFDSDFDINKKSIFYSFATPK